MCILESTSGRPTTQKSSTADFERVIKLLCASIVIPISPLLYSKNKQTQKSCPRYKCFLLVSVNKLGVSAGHIQNALSFTHSTWRRGMQSCPVHPRVLAWEKYCEMLMLIMNQRMCWSSDWVVYKREEVCLKVVTQAFYWNAQNAVFDAD